MRYVSAAPRTVTVLPTNRGTRMPATSATEYRYNRLTWTAMNKPFMLLWLCGPLAFLSPAAGPRHGRAEDAGPLPPKLAPFFRPPREYAGANSATLLIAFSR